MCNMLDIFGLQLVRFFGLNINTKKPRILQYIDVKCVQKKYDKNEFFIGPKHACIAILNYWLKNVLNTYGQHTENPF